MQTLKQAAAEVQNLSIAANVLLALGWILVRHFLPQIGAPIDKVVDLFKDLIGRYITPVDQQSDNRNSILQIITDLLDKQAAALERGDLQCVEKCNREIKQLRELVS